ncbi:hypothetical protein SNE40_011002 [Patella caerulea]|uniref:Uncharacterized protein n=1 Tax=Patella caerulea TaxID=87958 RepID=A0AAN8PSA5_PATCE
MKKSSANYANLHHKKDGGVGPVNEYKYGVSLSPTDIEPLEVTVITEQNSSQPIINASSSDCSSTALPSQQNLYPVLLQITENMNKMTKTLNNIQTSQNQSQCSVSNEDLFNDKPSTSKKRKHNVSISEEEFPITNSKKHHVNSDSENDDYTDSNGSVSEYDDVDEINILTSKTKKTALNSTNVLSSFDDDFDLEDTTGPALESDKLTHIVNKKFSSKIQDSKLKEKHSIYKRPEKCLHLRSPLTNPEVWTKLPIPAKKQETKLQIIQNDITKSAIAISTVIDKELEVPGGPRFDITPLMDSLTFLGHASQEMAQKRKTLLRPNISKDIANICTTRVPLGQYLFGDDLGASIKLAKETTKMTASFSRNDGRSDNRNDFKRPHKYSQNQSFLDKRFQPRNRYRQQYPSKNASSTKGKNFNPRR